MNKEDLKECLGPEFTFKIQTIITQLAIDNTLLVDPKRIKLQLIESDLKQAIRLVFRLATMEEQVYDYPADWLEWFKQRWFPKWLIKKYPIKMARVWSVHTFPELNIPEDLIGKEYVHFSVVDEKKLERMARKDNA